MMTQQLQAGLVSVPAAQIDRRALSQAWYSALHLAHGETVAPPPSERPPKSTTSPAHATVPKSERARAERAAPGDTRRERGAGKRSDTPASGDVRGKPADLARRIARTILAPRALPVRSTLTLGRGEGRVHLILQTGNGRVRLIALCRPADRDVVARAVAQARQALSLRGYELETRTGAFACS